MSNYSATNGPGPPLSNGIRHNVSIAPNTAPVVANFRPSEHYNHALASTQSGATSPTFCAPAAPMGGAIPPNANGLFYGSLPEPQSSQLPPIALPSNQTFVPPNGHIAALPGQQGGPVPSTPETTHQRHQSSEASQQDKRHKSSGRVYRSAEEIVAVFIKWLDEYDRRSQERYDAAKKMYNDSQVSERLGECLAGNRRVQEHHERITRLENQLNTADVHHGQISSRFAACETGLAQMGARMRQFEDDRMGFVSRETLDTLEIAHTQGAESRLRLVADSIRADLARRTTGLDRISEEVRGLIDRTSRIEESGFQKSTDTRLSNIEEQMRELQQSRRESSDSSEALGKIGTIESQITAIKNEVEGTSKTASHLDSVSKEIEQLEKTVRHLQQQQCNHAEFISNFPTMETQIKRCSYGNICREIKRYDPSRWRNNDLEQLISAVVNNPVLSARFQSNEHLQQHSQSQSTSNGESSEQAKGAPEGNEPGRSSTSSKDTDHAKDDTRNIEDLRVTHEHLSRLRNYLMTPDNAGVRKELVKGRRSAAADGSGSDDEIAVKRVKTKSNSRA